MFFQILTEHVTLYKAWLISSTDYWKDKTVIDLKQCCFYPRGSQKFTANKTWGAIHSTKIFGNFGLKMNGSVLSNRKSFEHFPPFEVDHFSRLDRSDRNAPFHSTIPTHSQSQGLAVRYLPFTKWRKIVLTADLSVLLVHPCTVTTGL